MKPEKHGAAAGEAGKPDSADWTIDQGWENYTAEEHRVWKTLFERQSRLLPGRACDEFIQGMRNLTMDTDQIPDFRRLSEVLMKRTGWQVVAVPGLVPDEVFFDHLANRRFPAGHFIRKPEELDYLEEPDVFHDVFGHVPMLMHPGVRRLHAGLRQGRFAGAEAWHAAQSGARLLVHGRVRADQAVAKGCGSTVPASRRLIPKPFSRWMMPRPTASVSMSNG